MSYPSRNVAIALVVLVSAAGVSPVLGAAGAADGTSDLVDVCFVVTNGAGWPLARINVTAIRTDISSPGSTTSMTTGPDGLVQLTLVRSAYRFVLVDEEKPHSPLRNGILYLPTVSPGVGGTASPLAPAYLIPGQGGTSEDACGTGVEGISYADGVVVMAGPPTQGFLEVSVVDAAAGATPLPDARIASLTIQEDDTTGARTGLDGKAYLPCVGGAPNNVTVTKDAFLANATTTTCVANDGTELTVNLWRSPVSAEFTITNETALLVNATGEEAAAVGPLTPLTNGRVAATGLPATISSAACASAATSSALDLRPAPLTSGGIPYVCSAPTDGQGRVTLLLPWAEEGAGEYELTASAPGYAPDISERAFTVADVLQPQAGSASGTGVYQQAVVLTRATVLYTGIVRDVHNATLADAAIFFNSTDAGGADFEAASDATGAFSLTLPTGPYTVTLVHDAKEKRTCSLQLGVDAAGAAQVVSLTDQCFRLVATGKAGVAGTALDGKTGRPIPGLEVCHGATPACDITSPDGTWEIETAPSAALSGVNGVRIPAGQAWISLADAFSGNSPAAGGIQETGPKNANRLKATLTIHVETADHTPLAVADVNVFRDGVAIHDTAGTPSPNFTATDGNYTLGSARDTVWTKHPDYSQFDLPPYAVETWKHRPTSGVGEEPLYAKASAAFDLAPSATHTESIVLDEIEGVFSVGILAKDEHSQTYVSTLLRAKSGTGNTAPGSGPDAANVTSPSTSTLTLYSQFAPYTICPVDTPLYQGSSTVAQARCATNVDITAGVVVVRVLRTTVSVSVRGLDPHSGGAIAGYNSTMNNTALNQIDCNGNATHTGFVCGARTAATSSPFKTTFTIPWTANADDICLDGRSFTYNVVPTTNTSGQPAESATPFLNATICQVWEPQTSYDINISPLRGPAANPLAGTVKDVDGTAMPDAIVNVTSDRAGFLCAPTAHHSPTNPYEDCESAPVDEDGAFSISVPTALANTTWKATANLTGYYNESYNLWPTATAVTGAFVLYPMEFQAVITVVEQSLSTEPLTSHACDSFPGYDVRVRLKDMQDGDPNPMNVPGGYRVLAPGQSDGTCVGIVTVKGWHRDPPTLPVALNQAWPVTSAPFIASTDHINHVGYMIANLGPADADRRVQIVMVHGDASSETGEHTLTGRVVDADAIADIRAQAGVPSRVTATPLEPGPDCTSAGVSTIAELDGSYSLPLSCSGAHSVSVAPLVASHWDALTTTIEIAPEDATVTMDFDVARKTTTLTVTVISPTAPTGASGIWVDPLPVDVTTDPARVRSGPGGIAQFGPMPWGLYDLKTFNLPSNVKFGTIAYAAPGQATATTIYP